MGVRVQVDGRWHDLDGRLAAIVRSLVSSAEEIERHPQARVQIDCTQRGVQLSVTRTWPRVEVVRTEHW